MQNQLKYVNEEVVKPWVDDLFNYGRAFAEEMAKMRLEQFKQETAEKTLFDRLGPLALLSDEYLNG